MIRVRIPLFLIYENNVAAYMLSISRLFADNNSLQYFSNNISYIEHYLSTDLNIFRIMVQKVASQKQRLFSLLRKITLFYQNHFLKAIDLSLFRLIAI